MGEVQVSYLFGFMRRPRCNALELKERCCLIQYLPGDKTKSALHLTRLNGYQVSAGEYGVRKGIYFVRMPSVCALATASVRLRTCSLP